MPGPKRSLENRIGEVINGRTVVGVVRRDMANGNQNSRLVVVCPQGHRAKINPWRKKKNGCKECRIWSTDEDALVRQHSGDVRALVELLPERTESAIVGRLTTLGVAGARHEARRPERWLGKQIGNRTVVEIDRSGATALFVVECPNGHRARGGNIDHYRKAGCNECGRIWSDGELAILHEYGPIESVHELVARLPERTVHAIKSTRARLGIQVTAETKSRLMREALARRTPEQIAAAVGRIDITGLRVGELEVLHYVDRSKWLCRCSCGEEVEKYSFSLRNGQSVICGKRTHLGDEPPSRHPLYQVWRQTNDSLCEAWGDSLDTFISDVPDLLGARPARGQLLPVRAGDVIGPGNAQWLAGEVVDYEGKVVQLAGLAARHGTRLETLRGRMARGEPLEEALKPGRRRGKSKLDGLVGTRLGTLTVVEVGSPSLCRCKCGGLVPVRHRTIAQRIGRVVCASCGQTAFRGATRPAFQQKMTAFKCAKCGKESERVASEVKRSVRRGYKLYCGWECSGHKQPLSESAIAGRRRGGRLTGGSMNAVAAANRVREAWRYAEIADALADENITFEFPLGRYIFDTAVHDIRVLIEFDEPFHRRGHWPLYDQQKDAAATAAGWTVERVQVEPATVIDPALVVPLLEAHGA